MDAPSDGDRPEPRFAWWRAIPRAAPRAREHASWPQPKLPPRSPCHRIASPDHGRGEGRGEGPGSWEVPCRPRSCRRSKDRNVQRSTFNVQLPTGLPTANRQPPTVVRDGAFTLIELLVVVAILGVLAALLLPVLSRVKETAKGAACLSNLRQVGLAVQLYLQDNGNRMPRIYDGLVPTNNIPPSRSNTVDVVLGPHLGNTNVLRCPSDRRDLFRLTGASYAWNELLNGQQAEHLNLLGLIDKPHTIPLFWDKEKFHAARGSGKERNFLYADGHIKKLLELEIDLGGGPWQPKE